MSRRKWFLLRCVSWLFSRVGRLMLNKVFYSFSHSSFYLFLSFTLPFIRLFLSLCLTLCLSHSLFSLTSSLSFSQNFSFDPSPCLFFALFQSFSSSVQTLFCSPSLSISLLISLSPFTRPERGKEANPTRARVFLVSLPGCLCFFINSSYLLSLSFVPCLFLNRNREKGESSPCAQVFLVSLPGCLIFFIDHEVHIYPVQFQAKMKIPRYFGRLAPFQRGINQNFWEIFQLCKLHLPISMSLNMGSGEVQN